MTDLMSIIDSGSGNALLIVSAADLKRFADNLISKTVKVVMDAQKTQEENYTIEETAKYLRVTQQTVYNYIKDGKLTPKKMVGRTLVGRFDLQNALASGAIRRNNQL